MDIPHQIGLITGAAKDYQDGLMSLETLVHKVEGLLGVIEDDRLSEELSDDLFDLEDINAHTSMEDYNFEAEGKSVVDRAVKEIILKTESYLARREVDPTPD